jgi:hypothetical protein
VDLSWSGASSPNIDIYRNSVVVATTGNDGFYTDSPGWPWPCHLYVSSVVTQALRPVQIK